MVRAPEATVIGQAPAPVAMPGVLGATIHRGQHATKFRVTLTPAEPVPYAFVA